MWHYGKAIVDTESERTFEEKGSAANAAREASKYRDDVLAVWSDDDPEYPAYLVWGGTVYSA